MCIFDYWLCVHVYLIFFVYLVINFYIWLLSLCMCVFDYFVYLKIIVVKIISKVQ